MMISVRVQWAVKISKVSERILLVGCYSCSVAIQISPPLKSYARNMLTMCMYKFLIFPNESMGAPLKGIMGISPH